MIRYSRRMKRYGPRGELGLKAGIEGAWRISSRVIALSPASLVGSVAGIPGQVEDYDAIFAATVVHPATVAEGPSHVTEASGPVLQHGLARELVVLCVTLVVLAPVNHLHDRDRTLVAD